MTLTQQIEAARGQLHVRRQRRVDELEEIILREQAPKSKDGERVLEIASELGLDPDGLAGVLETLRTRERYRCELARAAEAEVQLKRIAVAFAELERAEAEARRKLEAELEEKRVPVLAERARAQTIVSQAREARQFQTRMEAHWQAFRNGTTLDEAMKRVLPAGSSSVFEPRIKDDASPKADARVKVGSDDGAEGT